MNKLFNHYCSLRVKHPVILFLRSKAFYFVFGENLLDVIESEFPIKKRNLFSSVPYAAFTFYEVDGMLSSLTKHGQVAICDELCSILSIRSIVNKQKNQLAIEF